MNAQERAAVLDEINPLTYPTIYPDRESILELLSDSEKLDGVRLLLSKIDCQIPWVEWPGGQCQCFPCSLASFVGE